MPESEHETLSEDTEVTMNCNGPLEVTPEVRGIASCEGIPSVRTDKSYTVKSVQELYRGSEIQEFYRGANVLITGGTGFMGKVLMEKLLRSCPHISNIYLLVRSKKGKNVDSRIEELFNDPLFERLKAENNGFRKKIIAVEGDSTQPGLGLSPDNRQRIVEHVNIVFHMAATVRFNETLSVAVVTNVMGTRELMLLCQDCTKIKAMVHVSTAYSHCYRSDINEEFYDPPMTCDQVVKLIECLDENTMTTITPTLLGGWPNTYTYTKAIAEDTVRTFAGDLPVAVFRPSIILCTRSDPVPGWIDNHYGATGIVVGVGLGIIRTLHINEKTLGDMVPCDMAVSALVAAAWHIQERRRSGIEGIPVYNYVSSCENPITWDKYIRTSIEHSWHIPFEKSVWAVTLTNANVYLLYRIYVLLFHLLPAFMVDIVLYSLGQNPRAMKIYEKVHKSMDATSFFRTRQWKFSNQNVQQLWNVISEEDRKIFDFNICNLKWDPYLGEGLMGVRNFLLKDDPNKLSEAIKKRKRLYWLHQGLKYTLIFLFLWLCWLTTRPILRLAGETATVGEKFIS